MYMHTSGSEPAYNMVPYLTYKKRNIIYILLTIDLIIINIHFLPQPQPFYDTPYHKHSLNNFQRNTDGILYMGLRIFILKGTIIIKCHSYN